jgi:glutamate/tyrosine decarboxylase-like PLP-dependent enzyme
MAIGFPKHGMARGDVLADLDRARAKDADWRGGKTWSLVYFAGDEVMQVSKAAYDMFFSANGLSPLAFPSLRRFEAEILAMTADLLNGGAEAAGTLTSGGTESILMAVKAARDRARAERGLQGERLNIVIPVSAHPAFEKAAHYFDLECIRIPVRPDFKADVAGMRAAVNDRTALVVGSAPSYPQGVIDPIPEIAALAAERGISCHVDACLGGFLLPFFERLGEPVTPFDFRVPGVTSISADLHKYGFAARGASVVLYRKKALRRHQFFVSTDWSGGVYGSPSMPGSRPGGAIAAAWAVLRYLGEEGYLRLARDMRETTRRLVDGVNGIEGLRVLGKPEMTVFSFASDALDVYALGDAMEERGWKLDRQQLPPSLHLMVTPAHRAIVERFLSDLAECARAVRDAGPAQTGAAAMYGMLATIPDRGMVREMVLEFLDGLYDPDPGS